MDSNKKKKIISIAMLVVLILIFGLALTFCSKQGDDDKEPKNSIESSSDFDELLESEDLEKDSNVVEEYASEEKAAPSLQEKDSSDKKDEKKDTDKTSSVDAGNNNNNSNSSNAGNEGDSTTGGNEESGNTGGNDEGGNTEDNQPETNLKPSEDTEGEGYGPITFY